MERFYSVAIDGPGGAGKSTIARLAAKRYGFVYVDTGAIYRCVGLLALRLGTDKTDQKAVQTLLSRVSLQVGHDASGTQRMLLNGEDVTDQIRTPEVSRAASDFSALPEVRTFLLSMQRDFASRYSVIMDGRDIGTVVLPNADLKIFLTASPEARARRRYDELREKGMDVSYEKVLQELIDRDTQDTNRKTAPLRQAEDAVRLDTSGCTLEESIALVCSLMEEKLGLNR